MKTNASELISKCCRDKWFYDPETYNCRPMTPYSDADYLLLSLLKLPLTTKIVKPDYQSWCGLNNVYVEVNDQQQLLNSAHQSRAISSDYCYDLKWFPSHMPVSYYVVVGRRCCPLEKHCTVLSRCVSKCCLGQDQIFIDGYVKLRYFQ